MTPKTTAEFIAEARAALAQDIRNGAPTSCSEGVLPEALERLEAAEAWLNLHGGKHTQGKWEVVRVHGAPLGVGVLSGPIAQMVAITLFDGDKKKDMARRGADALLIAAAPDLYGACEYVAREIEANEDFDADELIAKLHAALKKAGKT